MGNCSSLRVVLFVSLMPIGCVEQEAYQPPSIIANAGAPSVPRIAAKTKMEVIQEVVEPVKVRRAPLLVSREDEELWRSFLPRGETSILRGLPNEDLIWYDEKSMPQLYQTFDRGSTSGILRVDGGQQTANNEFPWALPAGAVSGSNFKTLRFVRLTGMDWWNEARPNGTFSGWGWRYYQGTMFGELILVSEPRGDRTAFLRTRTRQELGWKVNQYSPFPTEGDFNKALVKHGWRIAQEGDTQERVLRSNHQRDGFESEAAISPLPTLPVSLVNDLLKEPFRSHLGDKAWSPTADGYNVVPSGWLGGFVPVDAESCMRCHDKAGQTVNLNGETRWRLRGGDGIFSFHPLDVTGLANGQIKLNQKLLDAGLLTNRISP